MALDHVVVDPRFETAAIDKFIGDVKAGLERIRGGSEDRFQDQLDLLLLGETVPAELIPTPDPQCRDCRGCGYVCDCHGIEWTWARTDHAYSGRREKCRCWSRGSTTGERRR